LPKKGANVISSFVGHANPAAQRAIDVLAAVVLLTLLAPAMLLIAIGIRVGTPGPVFFAQPRLGRSGKLFRIYKFRKFHHGSINTGHCVTLKNDPRMTRIGRLLERSKLDELPQLWNILRGDMSVVGPRPETTEFADCFTGRYHEVLERRPGLFGPSQTIFRNESALYPDHCDPHSFYRDILFPAKADIDLTYFRSRTLASDFLWIVRGMRAILGTPVNRNWVQIDHSPEIAVWSSRLLESISREPKPVIRKPLG
jgi:lipopolysaccharide/colanic/teichoic acid biosynthesis glycosyltransferase